MIKLKDILLEGKVQKISWQNALDRKFFGPVYHGTSEQNRLKIDDMGFKIFMGDTERSDNISHGYELQDYHGGIPAPIHHLGFGIYFTTNKNIAKRFNIGTARGLKIYYLDAPSIETINFGAPKTMMKWWIENGYDYKKTSETTFGTPLTSLIEIKKERFRATVNMTNNLKQKYDAVWFKGKGIYALLDGDQVCVYDVDNIFEVDIKLSKPGDVGSKVRQKSDGMIGVIVPSWTDRDPELIRQLCKKNGIEPCWVHPNTKKLYQVKWKKGGTKEVQDVEVDLL